MFLRTTLVFSLVCAISAQAANVSLSVEGAAAYAVSHNREIAAARFKIEEAKGRLDAAGRLQNPEVEFDFSQNVRSPERSFGATWMQRFPVTSRLKLEKAVSRAELAAAEAEVTNAERQLAGEARVAAISLLALGREAELRKQQVANSNELASFMGKRVTSGEAAAVDAAQVELETKQLGTQLLQLEVQRTTLLGSLRPLLGVGVSDTVEITGTLGEPIALPAKGVNPTSRGDYRAMQSATEAARQNVQLAKANKWADVGVGVTAQHERAEDAPGGFERDTMVGFKVSVPLPLWNKNEGQIREATAAAARTEKETEALALRIFAEVDAARMEMGALAQIVTDIEGKLIPQAKQIEEQLRSSYATGLTTLPEVIRARGRRFELEAQRLSAVRDYHLARAKHLTATGTISKPTNSKTKKK